MGNAQDRIRVKSLRSVSNSIIFRYGEYLTIYWFRLTECGRETRIVRFPGLQPLFVNDQDAESRQQNFHLRFPRVHKKFGVW